VRDQSKGDEWIISGVVLFLVLGLGEFHLWRLNTAVEVDVVRAEGSHAGVRCAQETWS